MATVHTASGNPSSPLRFARPATYYGDGPFEAASSESSDEEEDDESSSFLEKKFAPSSPGMAELGDGGSGLVLRDDNNTKVGLVSWQQFFLHKREGWNMCVMLTSIVF